MGGTCRLCSGLVLGPMLGAPTYQLHDLGLKSSPLCLILHTSEMRTLRNLAGHAPSPSEPSAKARSGGLSEGGAPHTLSRPQEATSPWPPPLTPAPAALPRSAPQTPPYMTPRAPRRSLSQLVSGPGSRAPPAASSSAGHRVRHLPSSPRIAPRRQSQPSARAAETWLPAGAASRGVASPALRFPEVRASRGRGHRACPETRRGAEVRCPALG